MKQYRTLVDIYLTFLTHNDSYQEKVPVGSILALKNNDLCYNDKVSIDYVQFYLQHGFVEELTNGSATQLAMGPVLKTVEHIVWP